MVAMQVDAAEVKAPRTASFGVDPSQLAGHHQMIADQPHLMAHERNAVDRHFRKRWVCIPKYFHRSPKVAMVTRFDITLSYR